ncbi:MAG: RNA 2'-phosphotransferase [Defluviitaleaceae bacterium]|nr:RNA 2'-phosphotransferase [Defluviitaleaceae bacterium]
MTPKHLVKISKFISRVLRHAPEDIGITLDKNGWASTQDLINGMTNKGKKIDLDTLKFIVKVDEKQRYKFNEDFSQIRASQGHSVDIDLALAPAQPPDILYHGTATRFLADIKKDGLISKKRHHVHLSKDKETAENVGARHGLVAVLTINAMQMFADGYEFFMSDNGVWLTESVPPRYIWQFTR